MMSHFIHGFFDVLTCGLFDYCLAFGGAMGCFALAFSIFCSRGDYL